MYISRYILSFLVITTPMKFTEFPYGSNNQIANPECGKKKASEVHFYINVMKYPDENTDENTVENTVENADENTDENTVENTGETTDENTDENDQTNSIDLVSIKLGDKFKLVLGMKHVKIFKVESENEERIIFKVC